jgi:predicted enzyme related to lactoylglutathione lyase
MATGTRNSGEFCWINIMTARPAEARAFFGKLLDWTYEDLPGMGHLVRVGTHHVGGLFDAQDPKTHEATPAFIGVMVKVDSADATCERVKSLGGQADPAFDVMEQGRMAVCKDPFGAQIDLWEAKKGLGTDVDSALHGAASWFEAMTTDVDRASKFYAGLFGWTPQAMPMPGFTYTVFNRGTTPVAGMMQITPDMGKRRPHWGTYFTVNDPDATVRTAVELGGTVCVPVQDIPGVGRFCGITSPQGVSFYTIKYTR